MKFAAVLFFIFVCGPAGAQSALSSEQEQRAARLGAELRCLVCQNQSIEDSNAPLAADLRALVRERMAQGDSDEAVRDYLTARYGDFILLRPRFEWATLVLWLLPGLVLMGAFLKFYRLKKSS